MHMRRVLERSRAKATVTVYDDASRAVLPKVSVAIGTGG